MAARAIRRVLRGNATQDGAGVRLIRTIGHRDVEDCDPFLLLDAFDSTDPEDYIRGFPWHPHRGIETVTYLVQGDIEHGDSLGNKGSILDGDCQWMTAGGGILHQEMPQVSKRMFGLQFWLNLPAGEKMTKPKYRDITADRIPIVRNENYTVRIISDRYDGKDGAMQGDHVKARFLDVEIKPGAKWSIETPNENTVFLYVLEGEARFDPASPGMLADKQAILFDRGDGVAIETADRGVRFVYCEGKPLKEPIAWGGPIVMNTREELNQAFRELDEGTFIRMR